LASDLLAQHRERYVAESPATAENNLAYRRNTYATRAPEVVQAELAQRRDAYATRAPEAVQAELAQRRDAYATRAPEAVQAELAQRRIRYVSKTRYCQSEYLSSMFNVHAIAEVENKEFYPLHLAFVDVNKCDSCKRTQIDNVEEHYKLAFHRVPSNRIRQKARFKLSHMKRSTTENDICEYNICSQCKCHLVDKDDSPENVWHLFLYCLLFGWHTSSFQGKIYHHSILGGKTLWRFIPQSIREWWIDEIAEHAAHNTCTLDSPASVFDDKTSDFIQFNNDFNSGQLARVCKAMDNHKIVDRNVLCPWSCSCACRDAGRISLDLVIQRMIPEVILLLFSDANTSAEKER
jgi:hypothetical protein